ncbi:hypothetical protein G7092_16960 [Mucilaginibacter sp. HC2]|uniref:hypothetical protein n=1 Tax=Mucilaginibacter TaxID=423349 RepID=UPI000DCC0FDC|nr:MULTISPECIES: hypothetical protein [Mucilaginibacter]NHA05503.1 hypothetical protein [Mucilaginibacter inviolabilis]QTE35311.1 hypothetical protein J3L18_19435 [Mucilaginibacter gossypii]RAV59486.1 hypothetical protein DIU36_06560 [Mucilaginibacter rubeus]
MTWIKFAVWLLGIYTIYYAALIFWDYLRTNRRETGSDQHELTFVEDVEPVKSHVEEVTGTGKDSSFTFSGGVNLKQLFNLAREESVEYIKAVSF